MTVTVLFFAGLRDWIGADRRSLDSNVVPGTSLRSFVTTNFPEMPLEGVRVARNEEFADWDDPLVDGDVIALIPPVSGG